MADKMTDNMTDLPPPEEFGIGCIDHSEDPDERTYLLADVKKYAAHIAARLGGGEGPVAWMRIDPAGIEPELAVVGKEWHDHWRAIGYEMRPMFYGDTTPPARLAATAVGVTEADYTQEGVDEAMGVLRGRHGSTALLPEVLDQMQAALEAALANQTED